MKVKIDQDELCVFCNNNEIADPSTCEGSRCNEAKGRYMGDHGLVEDNEKQTFSDIDPGDKLYVLVGNHMLRIEVSTVVNDGVSIGLKFGGTGISDALVSPTAPNSEDAGRIFFINKDTALSEYKKSMSETIIHMAETIANFSK